MGHSVKDWHDSVDGILTTRADMVEVDEHKRLSACHCSLIERVWMNGRRMKGLCGPRMWVRLTSEAVYLGEVENRRRTSAESDVSSPSTSEKRTGWSGKEKKRDESSGREQHGNRCTREGCCQPDSDSAFAGVSELPDSDSSRKMGVKVSFSSEHPSTTVVEAGGRCAHKENVDEKWNECRRSGIAKYDVVHRRANGGRGGERWLKWGRPFPWAACVGYARKRCETRRPARVSTRREKERFAWFLLQERLS